MKKAAYSMLYIAAVAATVYFFLSLWIRADVKETERRNELMERELTREGIRERNRAREECEYFCDRVERQHRSEQDKKICDEIKQLIHDTMENERP